MRFKATVVNELRQWHAGFFSDDLDGLRKSDSLDLHDEVENGTTLLTPEIVKDFFRRIDGKRRLRFFVKRATRHPIRARFFQRHIVLHDADNVRLAAKVIDEGLRETHANSGRAGKQNRYRDERLTMKE